MTKKQVIAVVEATGMQGGGLVRAIPADRESGLRVRALTRYVNSDRAKELTRLGAEVVAATSLGADIRSVAGSPQGGIPLW